MKTPQAEREAIAERIAMHMDGRTVTSHAHYREMLKEELVRELLSYEVKVVARVREEERNSYKFDIEGKMYLSKELVKHIEHDEKLNASFERGRVNAFEEMLNSLTLPITDESV